MSKKRVCEFSWMGALVGGVAGLLVRPMALLCWVWMQWGSFEEKPTWAMWSAFIPSALVGLVIGAAVGGFPRRWFGVVFGGLLSGVAFAAWSLGPLEAWLIDIRFAWSLLALFICSGALAGLAGAVVSGKRWGRKGAAVRVLPRGQYTFLAAFWMHLATSVLVLFRVASLVRRREARELAVSLLEVLLAGLRDGLLFPLNALLKTDQEIFLGSPGFPALISNSVLWAAGICLLFRFLKRKGRVEKDV